MKKCTINKLKTGERAIINKIYTKSTLRKRLQNIGLIEGTHIECVCKSPMGDPAAYLIRGAVIAIRNNDSKDIYAQIIDPQE